MAERATIFQSVQIGVEVTPGTGVAANKKLGALGISPSPKTEIEVFRPMGTKFPTITALGKEWSESKLDGQLTYSEIVYVLASLLKNVSPTRNIPSTGLSYTWTFAPAATAADTIKTYTVEQGDASSRAHKFAYGLISAAKFNFSRKECKLDGTMLGQALEDGITMTASPTAIALKPLLPTHVSVYLANTYAGLTGATALQRVISTSWGIENRFGMIWALNRSQSSWVAHVELEPKLTCMLKVEADAEGMALLAAMRAGDTRFMRIEAVGPIIETTFAYKMIIDTACKVSDVSDLSDEDGVYAIEWTLSGVYDATWAKATEVAVTNEISSL